MSAKQDRQGVRSPAELERKYNFERSFAEIMGVASDARHYAEEARSVASGLVETEKGLILKVQALDEAINGEDGVQAQLGMKVETDENGVLKSKLHIQGNQFTVDTDNFKLSEDGTLQAKEVDIIGGRLELMLSNGNVVRMGVDVDILAVDSRDFVSGVGTRVGILPAAIQFSANRSSVLPVQFGYNDTDGYNHKLVGTWSIEASGSSTPVTSDENKKHDIEPLSEAYSRLFDRLRPVTFKYNNGTSDRTHTGLIAQDVEEAVLAEGMTTKDFAAICYNVDDNGEKTNYGVRYEELVSVCIKEIQLLKNRINELERKTDNE